MTQDQDGLKTEGSGGRMNVREIIEKKKAQRLRKDGDGASGESITVQDVPGKKRKMNRKDAGNGKEGKISWGRAIAGTFDKLAGLRGVEGKGSTDAAGASRDAGEKPPGSPLPQPEGVVSPNPVHRETIGWVSPSYDRSRAVTLDPAVLTANRCVAFLAESPEADAYRVLRTRLLQRIRERGGTTVMVTSALPGEGKTLTAINLATTFAREFRQTVLLVDCDLKRQKIHDYLGYRGERGLIDYLLDETPVQELMVWPGIEKMIVISGGRTVGDSSELLGSQRMKELVADMRNRYPDRIVFFDVSPVLAGADALVFAPLVDHILVTVQAGATQVPEVRSALALLPADKIAGLVLNRGQSPASVYYPRRK